MSSSHDQEQLQRGTETSTRQSNDKENDVTTTTTTTTTSNNDEMGYLSVEHCEVYLDPTITTIPPVSKWIDIQIPASAASEPAVTASTRRLPSHWRRQEVAQPFRRARWRRRRPRVPIHRPASSHRPRHQRRRGRLRRRRRPGRRGCLPRRAGRNTKLLLLAEISEDIARRCEEIAKAERINIAGVHGRHRQIGRPCTRSDDLHKSG